MARAFSRGIRRFCSARTRPSGPHISSTSPLSILTHLQPIIAANCLSILAALLTLTSAHFIYQPLAQPILKKLLTAHWVRKLDAALAGANSELCLAALKLLNAVSSFAGGKEQKALLEAFSWDVKVRMAVAFLFTIY